jgi:urease accessory protein
MGTESYLALLLADGRLPSGAHTQSAGVEPALQHGLAVDAIPDYLTARLATVTEVEAGATVVAARCWPDTARLAALDRAWRVRTPADALRDASDLLARSYLRLASSVWDLTALAGRRWCRAVVVGATAAVAGLDSRATARLVGFEDVQTVIAAAMKLRPFDPAVGVAWAVAAGPAVEAMADRVAGLSDPDQLPAWSAPQLEQWAQAHVTTERRLFRA